MMRSLGKFQTNKRAITPVLSTLLLTVVAVAVMALATTATYVITSNLRDTMSERVVVEDVWFGDPMSINLYVRNIGKVAVSFSGVYVNHTSRLFTGSFRLGIGEHFWLNVSQSWVSGSLYYVDLVTARGLHVAGYYGAP
jgi:hypothetical protein